MMLKASFLLLLAAYVESFSLVAPGHKSCKVKNIRKVDFVEGCE